MTEHGTHIANPASALTGQNAPPLRNEGSLGCGPIRRRSLHEELLVKLREMIISGELSPGQKIPEIDISARYGVSRTPLREALKVLATEGLVALETNRGARVTRITRQDLEEVFPVMGALEALAGELACQNITDAEIGAIRNLHEDMIGHYRSGALQSYFAVNEQIHEAILAAARNTTLSTQYHTLAVQVRRARYVANMTPQRWQQAVSEHEEILRFLEARDGGGLSGVLKQHLQNKLHTVCDWLDQQKQPSE